MASVSNTTAKDLLSPYRKKKVSSSDPVNSLCEIKR